MRRSGGMVVIRGGKAGGYGEFGAAVHGAGWAVASGAPRGETALSQVVRWAVVVVVTVRRRQQPAAAAVASVSSAVGAAR